MKKAFKDLTDADVEYIKSIYYTELSHNEKIEILSDKFKVVGRTIRYWWQKLELGVTNVFGLPDALIEARKRELPEDLDILMVTSAQNKTVINGPMLKNMKAYCEFLEKKLSVKCGILVIPARYRNPTSPTESAGQRADEWWDHHVDELLYYNKIMFGDALISADSRVVPTANMPLTGYESLADENHLVLGHPRLHLTTLPRFKGEKLRIMTTTGFLTVKNYSRSKAGDKGFAHHAYGFVMLEKKDEDTCYAPRPVKVNRDGTFTDVFYHVKDQEVSLIEKSLGYIYGDIHHREINKGKMLMSNTLAKFLNPEKIVFHDLFDGATVNPHESDDLFIRKLKIRNGLNLIDEEVEDALDFLDEIKNTLKGEIFVVQSNHDDFLDRHINKFNWKNDLHNSEAYLKYAVIQQSVDLTKHGNILGYLIYDKFGGEIKYLKNCDPLRISNYQCGHHGDYGVNGARGNITSFKKLNTKMIHGHGHSPTMLDGVTMVGVSCNLWQYYNSNGMSSWAYADSIIHESGNNQLIIFDEDNFGFTRLIEG